MRFEGLGVAMVTPFDSERKVDFEAIDRIVENLIENGTDFLVLMGTTGEYPTLKQDEIISIIDRVKEVNKQRLPIVLGYAGNDTRQVLKGLHGLDTVGISGLMLTSPHYNKPTQQGIYQHYKTIANEISLPLIVYNVPSRTGVNILPETFIRLCERCPNIRTIKEATGDYVQAQELILNAPRGVQVLAGDDLIGLAMIYCGAVGSISVIGNAYPSQMSAMIRLARNGNIHEANLIQFKLLNMIGLIFREGNPTSVKALLEIIGLCSKYVRLPLVEATDTLISELKDESRRIN